tara:strand:+ start:1989 stop:2282 length:294 start_codon:yes stop_codon:yes gene_type:complete
LEHCSFILKEPTAFHQWVLLQGEHDIKKIMDILRSEIINNQNQMVFELMDIVDIGEKTYNNETLERVAIMLLDTKHTTTKMDGGKLLIKQNKKNGIN